MMPAPPPRSRDWYQKNAGRYDRRNPGLPGDREYYASLALGATVLEVGAGTGRITAALAERAARVIALDRASAMLTIASRRLQSRTNVSVVLGDARALPFDHPFDLIVLAYRTVHHLDAPARQQFWHDAARLLAPCGRLAFDTWHGPSSLPGRTGGAAFTPIGIEEIARELASVGLRVESRRNGFDPAPEESSHTRVWIASVTAPSQISEKNFTKSLTQEMGVSSMCTQSQTAHPIG